MPKLTFTLKLQAIKSGGGKGLRTRFRPHVHLPVPPQQHSVVLEQSSVFLNSRAEDGKHGSHEPCTLPDLRRSLRHDHCEQIDSKCTYKFVCAYEQNQCYNGTS